MTPPDEILRPGLDAIAATVAGQIGPGGGHRRLGPIWIQREDAPTRPEPGLYTPMLCVVAQGGKQILLGDARWTYEPGRLMLNSVPVPAAGGVMTATPACPCLWTMIDLDPALVNSVIVEAGYAGTISATPVATLETPPIDAATLGVVARLVALFETPEDAPFLAPLLVREAVYRLLVAGHGARLGQIAAGVANPARVLRAIEWLRDHYAEPLSIPALARECGLSPSSLHHRFKEVTAMSPLRYQKGLRLQEARRLMLDEALDAGGAGRRVGYDDPSQFSREYRRHFGAPPRRDVAGTRSG